MWLVALGTLSDTLAHVLFDTLADESNRINTERALHDRYATQELFFDRVMMH
jgi:hypothetical protein